MPKPTNTVKTSAVEVSCDKLGDLNGGNARLIIDHALQAAMRDLEDRAADDGKTRVVMIQIDMFRVTEGLMGIEVSCQTKTPKYSIPATTAKLVHKAENQIGALFQPACSDNPDQEPLPFDEVDK